MITPTKPLEKLQVYIYNFLRLQSADDASSKANVPAARHIGFKH